MDNIVRARRYLMQCERVLVITGAGISAASGIPTFEGAGERWKNMHVRNLAGVDAFGKDPRLVWDWYLYRRSIAATAAPNAAHEALAGYARSHPGLTLVTQNVDGLHEAAGHPDVVRIHGSLWHNRCTQCGREREERSLAYIELPRSPCCQALERPVIVWFGERSAEADVKRAVEAAFEAEIVITIGTSGKVNTANQLVAIAIARYAEVYDINLERSKINAHGRLFGAANEIVPQLLAA